MKTRFVDLGKFEETCREKGREEGREEEKLNAIVKLLKGGLAKMDILHLLGCSEEH